MNIRDTIPDDLISFKRYREKLLSGSTIESLEELLTKKNIRRIRLNALMLKWRESTWGGGIILISIFGFIFLMAIVAPFIRWAYEGDAPTFVRELVRNNWLYIPFCLLLSLPIPVAALKWRRRLGSPIKSGYLNPDKLVNISSDGELMGAFVRLIDLFGKGRLPTYRLVNDSGIGAKDIDRECWNDARALQFAFGDPDPFFVNRDYRDFFYAGLVQFSESLADELLNAHKALPQVRALSEMTRSNSSAMHPATELAADSLPSLGGIIPQTGISRTADAVELLDLPESLQETLISSYLTLLDKANIRPMHICQRKALIGAYWILIALKRDDRKYRRGKEELLDEAWPGWFELYKEEALQRWNFDSDIAALLVRSKLDTFLTKSPILLELMAMKEAMVRTRR